jgi:hypothetical protein
MAEPDDVARAMAFLASHRAAGHITGECLSLDGGMEGRLVWREGKMSSTVPPCPKVVERPKAARGLPRLMSKPRNKVRVAVSINFDAVSGWLGTGNNAVGDGINSETMTGQRS